jgi:hypothetical protein
MSELLSFNPYRILGVTSNTGQKEIQKNLSKMKAYAKLGRTIAFDFDFPNLNLKHVDRSEEIVLKIESKILLDFNKVKYALFWYQNITAVDSVAIDNLKNGDTEKSIEIFKKATKSDITQKNISAHNNLSTIQLHRNLGATKTDVFNNDKDSIKEISAAIGKKLDIIDSDHFNLFCNSLNIETDIDKSLLRSEISREFLNILLKNYSRADLKKLIDLLDERVSEVFSNEFVKAPVANIKSQIKNVDDALSLDVNQGIVLGKRLIRSCFADIKELDEILGKTHYLYEDIADKLSNQIMQCGIKYFNENDEDQDFLSSYKYALSIACSEKTKSRANDCIKHCEEEAANNICSSCKINKINKSIKKKVTMYKVTDRNVWTRQIKYQRLDLEIYFCSACLDQINRNSKNILITKLVITVGIGTILAVNVENLPAFFLGLLSYVFVSPIIDWINSFVAGKIEKNPRVKEALNQGFSFSEPS